MKGKDVIVYKSYFDPWIRRIKWLESKGYKLSKIEKLIKKEVIKK